MNITTRYEPGQLVRFVLPDNGKTYSGRIMNLEVDTHTNPPYTTEVWYWVEAKLPKGNRALITDKDIIKLEGDNPMKKKTAKPKKTTKKTTKKAGKTKRWEVCATLCVPIHVYVEAETKKEAEGIGFPLLVEKIPEPADIAESTVEEDSLEAIEAGEEE